MASTKTFADMKKPVRRPTAEEIAAFEETGRAAPRLDPALLATETQKSASPEPDPSGDADRHEPGKPQTQKSVNTPARQSVNSQIQQGSSTEIREHADTETRIPAKPETQEHGNPPLQESADTDARIAVNAESRKAVNTETRISAPIVRLTIDLPESVHTRFKTACAMTKRKMVDEVRAFIEQRAAELEGDTGRAL